MPHKRRITKNDRLRRQDKTHDQLVYDLNNNNFVENISFITIKPLSPPVIEEGAL